MLVEKTNQYHLTNQKWKYSIALWYKKNLNNTVQRNNTSSTVRRTIILKYKVYNYSSLKCPQQHSTVSGIKSNRGEKENNCAWCFCSVIEKSEQKLMGLSYVPQGAMKSFVFLIFSCVCLATSLYMFFILLETKGKTALEIAEEFRKIRGFGSPTESKCLETKLWKETI